MIASYRDFEGFHGFKRAFEGFCGLEHVFQDITYAQYMQYVTNGRNSSNKIR